MCCCEEVVRETDCRLICCCEEVVRETDCRLMCCCERLTVDWCVVVRK